MPSFEKWSLSVNWFGLIAGIFMIAFGVLAPVWWRITLGGEAVVAELSPFNINMTALGAPMTSTLISFICLGARIAISIAGVLMILGSLFTRQWWSRKLVQFGSLKMLWMVVGIVVMGVLMGAVVPALASGMAGGAGAQIQMNIPTLSGGGNLTVQMGEQATLSAPVTMALTGAFFAAIVASALGIAARVYHRRLTKK